MEISKYLDSQIVSILKQAEAGTPMPELWREQGMSSETFYKWRRATQVRNRSGNPDKKR